MVGEKSTLFDVQRAFDSLKKHTIISVVFDCRSYIEITGTMVGPRGTFICSIVDDNLTANRNERIFVKIVVTVNLHISSDFWIEA